MSANVDNQSAVDGDVCCPTHARAWQTSRRELEDSKAQIELLSQQVGEWASEKNFAESIKVASYVEEQGAARKRAEKAAVEERRRADLTCEKREQRYADMFHLVDQVDREIQARREAQELQELAEAEAKVAVQQANDKAAIAEVRAAELHAEIVPLRLRFEEVFELAEERQGVIRTLQVQLQESLEISESRALAFERANRNCHSAQEDMKIAQKQAAEDKENAAEFEMQVDAYLRRLKQQEARYADLHKDHVTATTELENKRSENLQQKHLIRDLQQTAVPLRDTIDRLQKDLETLKVDEKAWREPTLAITVFLRNFPGPGAIAALVRHMISLCSGTNHRIAIRKRLHQKGGLDRRELSQFLEQVVGLQAYDLEVIVSAFFFAMDVERDGIITEANLLERLDQAPSMNTLWNIDFERMFPDNGKALLKARGTIRSPSPPPSRKAMPATPATRTSSPSSERASSALDSSSELGPLKRRFQRPGSVNEMKPSPPPTIRPHSASQSHRQRSRRGPRSDTR